MTAYCRDRWYSRSATGTRAHNRERARPHQPSLARVVAVAHQLRRLRLVSSRRPENL